jgi:hypothetical protein
VLAEGPNWTRVGSVRLVERTAVGEGERDGVSKGEAAHPE